MNCIYDVADGLATCRVCGRSIETRTAVGPQRMCKAKPEPEALIPCVHRGAELRQVPCEVGCGKGVMRPVFACSAREGGECSATRIFKTQALGRGMPLCTKCDRRA